MNYPKVIGTYYKVLGWVSLVWFAVALVASFWTQWLHFDLSFILWFWLGHGLSKGNPTARKWAIRLSSLVTALFAIAAVLGLGSAKFGRHEFMPGSTEYYLIGMLIVVVLCLPSLSLIATEARAQFERTNTEPIAPDGRLDRWPSGVRMSFDCPSPLHAHRRLRRR